MRYKDETEPREDVQKTSVSGSVSCHVSSELLQTIVATYVQSRRQTASSKHFLTDMELAIHPPSSLASLMLMPSRPVWQRLH
jgi:hypothetical protein